MLEFERFLQKNPYGKEFTRAVKKTAREQFNRGNVPLQFLENNKPQEEQPKIGQKFYLHPNFLFDVNAGIVTVNGTTIQLTRAECFALKQLSEKPNRTVTHEEFDNGDYGLQRSPGSKNLKTHISHVRRKIEPNPRSPQIIETVKGYGYKLVDHTKELNGENPSMSAPKPAEREKPETVYAFPTFTYYPERFTVAVNGQEKDLTPKQAALLDLFVRNQHQVLPFDLILEHVWKEEFPDVSGGSLKTHITHLRALLGFPAVNEKKYPQIQSLPGIGYRFAPEPHK